MHTHINHAVLSRVEAIFNKNVFSLSFQRRAEVKYCSGSTPCGWEIYQPATRTTDFFVQSPCECPSGTRCMRYSDDISIAAYVYKCRPGNEEGHVWNE
ncbi:UNVERIFIED_CONTAM: hypothetical protein NCL1_16380 [Trichonephila clavipes]